MTATLPQLATAEILHTGFFARHVRRMRLQLENQVARYSQALRAAFPPGTCVTRPAGGSLLWVELPPKGDGTRLYRRALEHNISILPGEIFSPDGGHRRYIRISCGATWTQVIERAIVQLGRLV